MGTIFLYVILVTNNGREILRTPHPTYAACIVALDHAKQSSTPEDSRTVVMFCGAEGIEREYNDKWYHAK